MTKSKHIIMSLVLGKGEVGEARKEELLRIAQEAGFTYGNTPSHSKLLQAALDKCIEARNKEALANSDVEKIDSSIITANNEELDNEGKEQSAS